MRGNDTIPRRKVTPEVLEKMKRLRAEGMSYEKIARRLGLYPMTVYNHAEKAQEDEDNSRNH